MELEAHADASAFLDAAAPVLDTDEARRAGCDAVLRKPFEASVVMETIRPLVQEARLARGL